MRSACRAIRPRRSDWWRRGAMRGDADGQAMLGAACHLGAGVPVDAVEALAWLLRAPSRRQRSCQPVIWRRRAQRLSADEIAEAERRAAAPLPEVTP